MGPGRRVGKVRSEEGDVKKYNRALPEGSESGSRVRESRLGTEYEFYAGNSARLGTDFVVCVILTEHLNNEFFNNSIKRIQIKFTYIFDIIILYSQTVFGSVMMDI